MDWKSKSKAVNVFIRIDKSANNAQRSNRRYQRLHTIRKDERHLEHISSTDKEKLCAEILESSVRQEHVRNNGRRASVAQLGGGVHKRPGRSNCSIGEGIRTNCKLPLEIQAAAMSCSFAIHAQKIRPVRSKQI